MQKIINQLLQNGLRDFAGATISGSIPLRDETINQLLMEFLRDVSNPSPPATPPQTPASQLPIKQLAQHVKTISVKTENGKMTLQFQIEVSG